jgi:hypothetical protein
MKAVRYPCHVFFFFDNLDIHVMLGMTQSIETHQLIIVFITQTQYIAWDHQNFSIICSNEISLCMASSYSFIQCETN